MKTLVSGDEIEEVGGSLIAEYIGRQRGSVLCTDIEGFIKDYLHHQIEYLEFAEDDADKIGFLSDGISTLCVFESGKKKTILLPKGFIVIDKRLLSADNSGKRRFTLAHEAAHVIMTRLCPLYTGPLFKREFDCEREYNALQLHERLNIIEAQVDALASVLLMPRFLVEQAFAKYCSRKSVTQYGEYSFSRSDKLAIQNMADSLGVSFCALLIRLRKLKLIEYRDISEFISKELVFEGD